MQVYGFYKKKTKKNHLISNMAGFNALLDISCAIFALLI